MYTDEVLYELHKPTDIHASTSYCYKMAADLVFHASAHVPEWSKGCHLEIMMVRENKLKSSYSLRNVKRNETKKRVQKKLSESGSDVIRFTVTSYIMV